VDPWFIVSETPDEARLIRIAREVNDGKPEWVLKKVQQKVGQFLTANPDKTAKDVTIACFGLAFKPNIDDLRESPALAITGRVIRQHPGKVLVVEPNVEHLPTSLGAASLVTPEQAFEQADIAVLLVDHKQFRGLQVPGNLGVVDTRGLWK
jgi:UDP-N-acetyl-D-mannosaminuronic acid dehydrogenase